MSFLFIYQILLSFIQVPPDHSDVNYSYGRFERTTIDLWLAKKESPTPLVIYFHGGGFRGGDKKNANQEFLKTILENGISFASVNYRLTWQAPFPAQLQDAGAAIQFLREHAEKFNLQPSSFGAIGESAGGVIALWLAFNDDSSEETNPRNIFPFKGSTKVQAAVGIAAQTTLDPRDIFELFNTNQLEQAMYGFYGIRSTDDINNPKFQNLFEWASPINHVDEKDPPVLLHYWQKNETLPRNVSGEIYIHHPKFGFYLKEKMDSLNVECILKLYEQNPNQAWAEIVDFFNKHLN
tara:strand:+ start:1564 stop:2445 length:882 start_codon:yes stop_codon:yes gene_type:complete